MIQYNDKYDNEIKEIILVNPRNYISVIKSTGFKNRYKNRSYLIDYINSVTPQLNDNFYTLKTKLFWVINKIQDFPQCKCCGKPLDHYNIRKLKDGYKLFCSYKCMYNSSEWKTRVETGVEHGYGVKNYFMSQKFMEDMKKNKDIINQRRNNTKKKNKTFNKSKIEDEIYDILLKKYGSDDIKRQYTDKRYPFECDFYIVSLDLFIEFNGMWTHGTHAYCKDSINDINQLNTWNEKAKTSKFYQNAVYNWTIRDVKKRNIAHDNNLKFYEFWNKKDLVEFVKELI